MGLRHWVKGWTPNDDPRNMGTCSLHLSVLLISLLLLANPGFFPTTFPIGPLSLIPHLEDSSDLEPQHLFLHVIFSPYIKRRIRWLTRHTRFFKVLVTSAGCQIKQQVNVEINKFLLTNYFVYRHMSYHSKAPDVGKLAQPREWRTFSQKNNVEAKTWRMRVYWVKETLGSLFFLFPRLPNLQNL